MLNQIVPQLYRHLSDPKTNEPLRISVALTIVKILKVLPPEILEGELPTLLSKVCRTLNSRVQLTRNQTRGTLVEVAKVLGPKYFLFIVQELKSILTRGYQVPVLSYTVHSLLVGLAHPPSALNPGDIDHCLSPLLEVLIEDILGETAESKEVEAVARATMEAKKNKSFDSFEMLARITTFPAATCDMLDVLTAVMKETNSLKKIQKLTEVLGRISNGIQSNPTLKNDQLLIFVHDLISKNLEALPEKEKPAEQKTKRMKKNSDELIFVPAAKPKVPTNHFFENSHILVEFGLSVLNSYLKKSKLNIRDATLMGMLDPFVELVQRCLRSKYTLVQAGGMRCLRYLIPAELPSLKPQLDKITKKVFELIQVLFFLSFFFLL
jgi:U3 small nucleolar RNA-associated protein 20